MRRNIKILTFIIGAFLTFIISSLPLSAQTTLTEQSKLAIDRVTRHEYTFDRGGHYLTFIPKDERDRNYRLVF